MQNCTKCSKVNVTENTKGQLCWLNFYGSLWGMKVDEVSRNKAIQKGTQSIKRHMLCFHKFYHLWWVWNRRYWGYVRFWFFSFDWEFWVFLRVLVQSWRWLSWAWIIFGFVYGGWEVTNFDFWIPWRTIFNTLCKGWFIADPFRMIFLFREWIDFWIQMWDC